MTNCSTTTLFFEKTFFFETFIVFIIIRDFIIPFFDKAVTKIIASYHRRVEIGRFRLRYFEHTINF
jgi:hypothetical protein